MRHGGGGNLPHFFFFFHLRVARKKDAGWVSAAGQSERAPTEERTQQHSAEATQREKTLPTFNHLSFELASPSGKWFRAHLVWVELAGINPGTCVRELAWSSGRGQGPQVLIIQRSPGAHGRSERLLDRFVSGSRCKGCRPLSVKLWSRLMYVLCSLAVLALHGFLRSWSRRDPVQEKAGKTRREGGGGRRKRGGGRGGGAAAAQGPVSRGRVQVSWNGSDR